MATGKWHVTPEGAVKPCSAKIKCDYAGNPHGATERETAQLAEAFNRERLGDGLTALRKAKGGKTTVPPTKAPPSAPKRPYGTTSLPLPAHLQQEASREEALLREARGQRRGFTPQEMKAHTAYVTASVAALMKEGATTDKLYTHTTPEGKVKYSPERVALHKAIVDRYDAKARTVPSDRKVIFAGGLGGAGKSFVLGSEAGVDPASYVTINTDDIKEMMADMGAIPAVEGLTPMEASPLVHAEASMLSKLLMKRYTQAGKNTICDNTMANPTSSAAEIESFRKHGYSTRAVFVDITVENSARRGQERHQHQLTDYLQGKNARGGRFLPASVNNNWLPSEGSGMNSKNAEVFAQLQQAGYFDQAEVFDNNVYGRKPQRVDPALFVKGTVPQGKLATV